MRETCLVWTRRRQDARTRSPSTSRASCLVVDWFAPVRARARLVVRVVVVPSRVVCGSSYIERVWRVVEVRERRVARSAGTRLVFL